MRAMKTWWMTVLVGLLVIAPSCTNDSLDDGDSADVVLEVLGLTNPAVTANTSSGASGSCAATGTFCVQDADCGLGDFCVVPPAGCTLEVEEWVAQVANKPKNSLAGANSSPFNDVSLEDVVISYSWLNGVVTPTRVVGLGGVTIPAEGTTSVTFEPIAFDDLGPAVEGSTANLTLTFRARTVEGTVITGVVSRQLFVETCN